MTMIKTSAALFVLIAVGCASVDGGESESLATSEQAVTAAASSTRHEAFQCRPSGKAKAESASLLAVKPVDDQYRAPSTPKPLPDPAAESAAFVAPAPNPKELEKQARYAAALADLRAKHPHQGEEFEKARRDLKRQIIAGLGAESAAP